MRQWTHVTEIGRIELRRRWRVLKGNTGQLIAITLTGLFFVPLSMLGMVGLYFFGREIASGGIEMPLEWVRMGSIYLWLSVAGFGGYRAYATALRPDRLDGLLTTVSHRELLGGLLFAEYVLWGGVAVLASSVGALAFAAGARSVVLAPLGFLAVCLTLTTALALGFLVALLVRNTGVRSKLATRLRTVLFGVLGIAYFWLIISQNFASVLEPLFRILEPTPVGWYGDLVLLGTVSEASIGRSVGAVLSSVLFVLASGVLLPRLAEWLWYADGVHIEHEVTGTTAAAAGEPRLSTLLPRPVVGVVLADWKRARRAPIALSFVLYPLIVLISPIMTVFQTGTVGSTFPLWIVLCGAWIAGSLFTLNVVGNEGAVLPATLLGGAPGRTLVGGHVVAGTLLVAPVTVLATVGVGLASPHSVASVLTLALSGLVLALCAGPIATGIGAAFPRFEAVSVSRSRKAIVPSMLAFTVYSVVLFVVALPALLGHVSFVADAFASLLGTSSFVIALSGTVLTALAAGLLGVLSAYYAVRSVETFHFD
ncbi:hypothetical protein GS429_00350 [Natronorubrum sp. JWXQ-INN-674]|uniref:ABC-2 type transport system permease protein n=1 Tax=Natronorubrum halalkaliphilum TaxID=2691917 RepID=A0A6B0VIB4_9EURY|nr:hypothetical protein [Natronorubrum halalkaliphilum]MXV60542.1 hypothetical protein [Natronorubrum halalkaliphilum]